MTATISISPARPRRQQPVAAPNYLVRRVVAGLSALAVVVATVLVMSAMLAGLGGAPAGASAAQPASPAIAGTHVAAPGDTLWSIAERYRGEVDQGRYVDALIQLNGGTSIQVGQAVRLP